MFKKGDTCSFSHVELAQGDLRGEWSEAKRTSSPASQSKATQTDGEGQKTSLGSGSQEESSF